MRDNNFNIAFSSAIDKELNSINSVIVQILRLCMPENTLPVTNLLVSFELPKNIVHSTSGDDNGSEEVEKDSDEGTGTDVYSTVLTYGIYNCDCFCNL